jgi:hypothetical protein
MEEFKSIFQGTNKILLVIIAITTFMLLFFLWQNKYLKKENEQIKHDTEIHIATIENELNRYQISLIDLLELDPECGKKFEETLSNHE